MNPAVVAIAVVLTVIGWGGGELFGHGVNRYLTRRSVKRWLDAERGWHRWIELHKREAGKPRPRSQPAIPNISAGKPRGPMPKPRCRPGTKCWQGCEGCRPKRGVLAESVRNNPQVIAAIEAEVGEILAFRREDMKPVAGRTCPLTGGRITTYKERIDPGHIRFTEYRDGEYLHHWVAPTYAGRTGET